MTAPQLSQRPAAGFGAVQRWKVRLTVGIGLLLGSYLLLIGNLIAFRHPWRIDLTTEGLYTLSRETLDRLKLVHEEIEVVIPTLLLRDNPEHAAVQEVLRRARATLNEISSAQPLVRAAVEVDVLTDPARWEELRARFDLETSQVNRILFFAGKSKELRQAVLPREMAVLGEVKDPTFDVPEVKKYLGEKAIVDSISRLISENRRVVYFSQDRRELLLSPRADAAVGLGGIRRLAHELATEGLEARELSLSTTKEVPADCDLLILAGPSQPYGPDELRVIDAYLQRGGRVLATLSLTRTGLEDLLKEWGVKVRDGNVQCRIQSALTQQTSAEFAAADFDKVHPATRAFRNSARFEVQFRTARPLLGTAQGKGLEPTAILVAQSRGGRAFFVVPPGELKEALRPEDVPLAVAVEQHVPDRPPPGFQRRETRLIVVGGSTFLSDQLFSAASNRDFCLNCIRWLLGEEELAADGGAEWAKRTLRMDASIERFLFWVPIFLLPGIFLCAGTFIYYSRRT